MMTTYIPAIVYILLISNLLLVSAVGLAVIRFLDRVDELETLGESPNGTALAEEDANDPGDDVHLELGRRLERRIDDLHRIVRIVAAQHNAKAASTATAVPVATVVPMNNALRMAKQGATIDELTRNCGLSIGEARLMRKLHGKAASHGVH